MSKVFAHRGFSGKYPENTLLAFQKALETGCHGVELDVHLTKDNVLVIIHDETLERTTDGAGWVKDYTYDELCRFNAAANFPGCDSFERIPTLREYFELIADHKDFITNIELKTSVIWYEGIEAETLKMLDEFDRRDTTIISSFNHLSVLKMKELAPDMKCGFLEDSWLVNQAEYCTSGGVECFHPYFYNMVPEEIAKLKKAGIEINVWTVNTDEEINLMLDRGGIDGLITNFPDRCLELVAARK